jgi:hypothetical protein
MEKATFKRDLLGDKIYSSVRAIIRFKVLSGSSLEVISEGSGVDLRNLKTFYYGYDPLRLSYSEIKALLSYSGYRLHLQILPIVNRL